MTRQLDIPKVNAALDEAAEAATTGSREVRAGRFVWVRAHTMVGNGRKVSVRAHKRPQPNNNKGR